MTKSHEETVQSLLMNIRGANNELPPEKLEMDESGRLLLDPQNKHHMKWFNNDKEYTVPDED